MWEKFYHHLTHLSQLSSSQSNEASYIPHVENVWLLARQTKYRLHYDIKKDVLSGTKKDKSIL
jgi:hypothetical protein